MWRGETPAPRAPDKTPESVLLLRNGRVLQGRIRQYQDRYVVAIDGGEITVRASEVQQVCRDITDAYRLRRAAIRLDSAQEHVALAQWCQRVGLLDLAFSELAEAKAIDPSHPMLSLLERQFRVASEPKEQAAGPAKLVAAGPTVQDLDRMVRAMPPKTVETFTQVIQPMLTSQCASSGCHGSGAQNHFQMLRPPPGGLPSRRLTQRNLYAVLELVDRDDPAGSPLLTVPSRPHGTAKAPVFTHGQTAVYGQLLDWCYRVSGPTAVHASYEQPILGSRNEPGSASAARAAMRGERTRERDAAKTPMKQRVGHTFQPPFADSGDQGPRDGAFPLTRLGSGASKGAGTDPPDAEPPGLSSDFAPRAGRPAPRDLAPPRNVTPPGQSGRLPGLRETPDYSPEDQP